MKLSALLQMETAVDPASLCVRWYVCSTLHTAFVSALLNCSHLHILPKCYLFSQVYLG